MLVSICIHTCKFSGDIRQCLQLSIYVLERDIQGDIRITIKNKVITEERILLVSVINLKGETQNCYREKSGRKDILFLLYDTIEVLIQCHQFEIISYNVLINKDFHNDFVTSINIPRFEDFIILFLFSPPLFHGTIQVLISPRKI